MYLQMGTLIKENIQKGDQTVGENILGIMELLM